MDLPSPPSSDQDLGDRGFTRLLIASYRGFPELWKVKSKDYFNKSKKAAALQKIVVALKHHKPDFTVEQLKKKINVLRTNFNKDIRKIESAKRSGTATEGLPEPSTWYYNDFLFIKDQFEIAETQSSEPLLPDEDKESLFAAPSPSAPSASKPYLASHKKRKRQPDSIEQLVGLATEYFKRPETEEDILAKGWAIKLKKLRPDQRCFAEKIISDAIFEAEMGTLTREGVHFASYSHWSPSPPSISLALNRSSHLTHPSYIWQHYSNSAQPVHSSRSCDSSSSNTLDPLQHNESSEDSNA